MTIEWNIKYFDKVVQRASIIVWSSIALIFLEYYYLNLSIDKIIIPLFIIIVVSKFYEYLRNYKKEHMKSKVIVSNDTLRYIQPSVGYDVEIKIKDIEKITYRKFIFSTIVIDINENQRFTFINFLNSNDFKNYVMDT